MINFSSSRRVGGVLVAILIVASITIGFGKVYFDTHAYGAWGDDSAGYIYLAGRLWAQEPLVTVDPLAVAGLDFFGNEKLARWLIPTHHQFINPDGTVASKYPTGLSWLMYLSARMFHSSDGFYTVVPAAAVASLVSVYVLAVLLLPQNRWRHLIGVLTVAMLGTSDLFYDLAISQPMREIPSVLFLLLSTIALVLGMRAHRRVWRWSVVALAGLLFGIACTVRETSVMVLPALVGYAVVVLWKQRHPIEENIRRITPLAAGFVFAMLVGISPLILNSVQISEHKVAFKARDTGSVVLLSNIGHVESLSIDNLFSVNGKFRPDSGSVPHYWNIIQHAVPVPYFFVLVCIGVGVLWMRARASAVLLVLWFAGIFIIFSLWINPYSRYILPLLPVYVFLGAFGLMELLQRIIPRLFSGAAVRALFILCVCATSIIAYVPVFAKVGTNLAENNLTRFRALSQNDLNALTTFGSTLAGDPKALVLFTGEKQFGTSETFEAHTGVKAIRFPLEQRFDFRAADVYAFFDQLVFDGYHIVVWTDSTSSADVWTFLDRYDLAEVQTVDFSFQNGVQFYKIVSKK